MIIILNLTLMKLIYVNFHFSYDYENVDIAPANQMMANLEQCIAEQSLVGKMFSHGDASFKLVVNDNFEYTDPIDNSVTKKQVCSTRMLSLGKHMYHTYTVNKRIFLLLTIYHSKICK